MTKPRRILLTLAAVGLALALPTGCGAPKVDPLVEQYYRDSLEVLAGRCHHFMDNAYLEGHWLETNKLLPGWRGYPVKLWEYWTDFDSSVNGYKRGLVYLLKPEPEKVAKWIVNAVFDATGTIKYEDIEKVRMCILVQSGAQFVVSGVVYEALDEESVFDPYVFKNGVTVYLADQNYVAQDSNCTEEQLLYCLHLTNRQIKENTGKFANICSTTREMYYEAGGTRDVGTSEDGHRSRRYLSEVARLFKKAWRSDKNFLIYAWAKANL